MYSCQASASCQAPATAQAWSRPSSQAPAEHHAACRVRTAGVTGVLRHCPAQITSGRSSRSRSSSNSSSRKGLSHSKLESIGCLWRGRELGFRSPAAHSSSGPLGGLSLAVGPFPSSSPFPSSCRPLQRRVAVACATDDANSSATSAASEATDTASPAANVLLKALSAGAEVSVMALVATGIVQEAQNRHVLAPTAAAALGRTLMGAQLLAAMKGPDETVQVVLNGRGPIGKITALASEAGEAKGFVGNPKCDPPLKGPGKMDVGAAVGQGLLTVIRSHPLWQAPYTGTVPLQTGEVAEDIAHYLAESEQINSAIGLGVAVGRDGSVRAAGGFLVQVLPFCSEDTLSLLERNVSSLPPMSEAVQQMSANQIIEKILDGIGVEALEDPRPLSYGPCSLEELKPRMKVAVESLGAEDVRSLLQEQGGKVQVRCEFCSVDVEFTEEDLIDLLQPATSSS